MENIKFLELPGFIDESIYSVFDLIESIEQNLSHITIDFFGFHSDYCSDGLIEFSSILLQNLGQILPFRLEYLHLKLYIKITASDFEVFLKNSQNTFINKLLIDNYIVETEDQDILPYLFEEYIVKKKRVKYLYLENDVPYLDEQHELNNIIIQDYHELFTEFYDYITDEDWFYY